MFSLVLTQLSVRGCVRAGGPEAVSLLVNFNRFKQQKNMPLVYPGRRHRTEQLNQLKVAVKRQQTV